MAGPARQAGTPDRPRPTSPLGQTELAGMPVRLFTCTPTRLTNWLDCPRRYRMTYLDRPRPRKGPPWAHTSLGVSVHNALAAWFRLSRERRADLASGGLDEQAAALVGQAWVGLGYRDDAHEARWRSRAARMVARYLGGLDPTQPEPVGLERTVGYRSPVLAFSGRVDRIDRRRDPDGGHRPVVVDYKTGRRELTLDDTRASLALALYALATGRTLGYPCLDVELHHLPTGSVIAWRHDEAALARHLRRAEALGAEAAAAEGVWRENAGVLRPEADAELFPPRPGPLCAWCDFAQHCPEGRAAAPVKKPWDGLPDDHP